MSITVNNIPVVDYGVDNPGNLLISSALPNTGGGVGAAKVIRSLAQRADARQTNGCSRTPILTAKLRKSVFLNNLACISNNAVDIVQKLK